MIRVASLRLSSMQPLRAGLREPLAFHGWGATWSEQLHAGSRTQQQQGAQRCAARSAKGRCGAAAGAALRPGVCACVHALYRTERARGAGATARP